MWVWVVIFLSRKKLLIQSWTYGFWNILVVQLIMLLPKNLFRVGPFFSSWLGLPLEFGSPLTRRKNDFAWYDGHRSIDSFLKYLPPPQSNYLNYSLNPELNSKHSGLDMFTIFISGRICHFLREEQKSLHKLLSENLKYFIF